MKRLKTALMRFAPIVLSAVYGFSLTLMYDLWDLGGADAGYVIGYTLLAAAVLGLMSVSKLSGWITLCFLAVFAGVKLLGGWKPITYVGTVIDAVKAGEGEAYVDQLTLILSLCLMVAAYTVLNDLRGVSLLITIALMCFALFWFADFKPNETYFVLAVFALCSMYALTGRLRLTGYRAMISLALIAALLSWALVPKGVTVPALENASRKAVRLVIDTFNLDRDELEQRRSFNIGSYGWRTRNETFGGPAYPRSDEVLKVTSEGKLYLRGSIRYTYNGRAWVDESNTDKAGKIRRYMLSGIEGLLYRGEYEQAFDLDKSSEKAGFELRTASVDILGDNLYWAVYTPNRASGVESGLKVYYNNIGEMFASRRLEGGDSYAFDYWEYADEAGIADAINAAEDDKDDNWPFVILINRDVPAGVDVRVHELTEQIVRGSASPYETALAIRDYLSQNGRYTLNPGYVPEGEDFVSWFMLHGMNGYCMYYASAMTLMARIAGLPARYVEGYLVKEGGENVLTGENAHAWCEVYFKGFGWVTFDATPSDTGESGDEAGGHSSSENRTPPPSGSTPTPTPTPTPAPTPSPAPEEDDTNWPDDDRTDDPPENTPGPSWPDEDDGNTPEPENDAPSGWDETPEDTTRSYGWLLWLLLALLAAGAAAGVTLRIRKTDPKKQESGYRTNTEKLLLWYRLSINALKIRGMDYVQGFTPAEFASSAVRANAAPEEFQAVSADVARAAYGRLAPDPKQVARAENCYYDILRKAGRLGRTRLLFKRIFSRGKVSLNIP
ncbi:MAG: transglutaminase domain-containing protein, partial [Clostridia bacterium]|nr:transglutaminase domain-containing protein [Clostridia bacterium]